MQARNNVNIERCPVCGQAEGEVAIARGEGPFCIGCSHPLPAIADGQKKRVVSLSGQSARPYVSAGIGPESYAVVMEKAMASIWAAGGLKQVDAPVDCSSEAREGAAGSERDAGGKAVALPIGDTVVEPWTARRPAKKTVGSSDPEPTAKASIAKGAQPAAGFYRESGAETLRAEGAAVARALHKKKIALPGEREQAQKRLFVHGAYARSVELGEADGLEPWSASRRRWAAIGCVFLVVALASQLTIIYRSELASKNAWAKTMLEAACAPMRCVVGRAKAISEVELEAAQVQVDSNGRLEFSGVLKNKAGYESEAPRLWLAIEGADGAQIAAKIFEPSEWLLSLIHI